LHRNLPDSYTANYGIKDWDLWFKIIQPKEYGLEESLNFERGQDPKVSMDIGNKWARIKVGDIIECIKEVIVEGGGSQEFLTFKEYVQDAYLGDSDYYFIPGNAGVVKNVVNLPDVGLRISIIPVQDKEEAKGINPLSPLFSPTKGTAPIDTWAKFFRVV